MKNLVLIIVTQVAILNLNAYAQGTNISNGHDSSGSANFSLYEC